MSFLAMKDNDKIRSSLRLNRIQMVVIGLRKVMIEVSPKPPMKMIFACSISGRQNKLCIPSCTWLCAPQFTIRTNKQKACCLSKINPSMWQTIHTGKCRFHQVHLLLVQLPLSLYTTEQHIALNWIQGFNETIRVFVSHAKPLTS